MTLKNTDINEVRTLESSKDNSFLILEKQLKDAQFSLEDIDYIFEGIKGVTDLVYEITERKPFAWKDFYVGICTDYKERVLKAHNVKDEYRVMGTKDEKFSRLIERYFIKYRGAKGDTGGGTKTASPIQVYVYRIKEGTVQNIQEKINS